MMATSISRLNVLGPEDLRVASDAFEAALYDVNEQTSDIHPYTARCWPDISSDARCTSSATPRAYASAR